MMKRPATLVALLQATYSAALRMPGLVPYCTDFCPDCLRKGELRH